MAAQLLTCPSPVRLKRLWVYMPGVRDRTLTLVVGGRTSQIETARGLDERYNASLQRPDTHVAK